MKKRISLAFLAGACLTAFLTGAISVKQTRTARDRERKLHALTEQVEFLGQTVVGLRKDLSELRAREKRLAWVGSQEAKPLTASTEVPGIPTNRVLPNGPPPAGQPFEFNGRTYYLTPLESRAGVPSLVAR